MAALREVMSVVLVSIVFATAVQPAPGEPQAKVSRKPTVVLKTSSRDIEIGDLVVARVTLINGTSAPVTFSTSFASATGIVQFRIRAEGDWQVLYAEGQGAKSPQNAEFNIEPEGSRATIETLFYWGDEPVFGKAGRFEISAVVRTTQGDYWSKPISVSVKECADTKRQFLTKRYRDLSYRIHQGGPSRHPLPFAAEEVESLPECLLQRQLRWDATFYQWAVEANSATDDERWTKVRELLPTLDSVNQDRFRIGIALAHYQKQRYADVLAALDKLPDPTPTALWLRGEIRRATAPPP